MELHHVAAKTVFNYLFWFSDCLKVDWIFTIGFVVFLHIADFVNGDLVQETGL
jgi:hypothetical protein